MSMHPIASAVVSSSGPYIATFNDIPQTYTHLQLRIFSRGTAAAQQVPVLIQFNGDISNSTYSYHDLKGEGATTSNASSPSATFMNAGYVPGANATANTWGTSIIDIYDYKSTVKNKTMKAFTGYDANGSGYVGIYGGSWFPSTITAINSIYAYLGNAAVGSRIDLYGIAISNTTGA